MNDATEPPIARERAEPPIAPDRGEPDRRRPPFHVRRRCADCGGPLGRNARMCPACGEPVYSWLADLVAGLLLSVILIWTALCAFVGYRATSAAMSPLADQAIRDAIPVGGAFAAGGAVLAALAVWSVVVTPLLLALIATQISRR
jgi:hypothetical protein